MKHLSKSLVMLLAAVVLLAGCTKKSSEKQILSFSFYSPEVEATIMESAKTIVATVPTGTDLTALVPIITVSEKATINPASGVRQDFTNTVMYTVTAEDGSQASYAVAVTVEGNGGGNGGGGGGEEQQYSISATANPTEGGTVSGYGLYASGESCTLIAMANSGYTFTNWTENGSEVSTDMNYTFTVTGSRNLVANFTYNGGGGGSSDGRFSVSETQKVDFAPGNLQYQASTGTWRFAEHQYDYVGEDNEHISSTYSGWIDLFGWGTWTGSSPNPYITSKDNVNYTFDPADFQGTVAGYESRTWRTPTKDEWTYVFDTRSTPSGIRFAKAQVNEVNGVILLPDDWNASTYALNSYNTDDAGFSSNVITALEWTTLENAGAVFLPAAGGRYGTSVSGVGSGGYYWSASYDNSYGAYNVFFSDGYLSTDIAYDRYYGFSVRLVCPAE